MKKIKFGVVLLVLMGLQLSCVKCNKPVGDCALIPDSGPCEAAITKYYYDQDAGQCKEFIWGGCEGTVPFDSIEECRECLDEGK